ncbi:hypothetical protein CVT24_009288 [Panaeolus cyanescens]|uniref:Uncharacterized protein n=1 Tax=Panaeolus cyanescens TaxID=181874 RepID=A0A409Y8I7_9AGAR|nr:hypothetical protein CVT24_009288 [Panaeolus cyanescens]
MLPDKFSPSKKGTGLHLMNARRPRHGARQSLTVAQKAQQLLKVLPYMKNAMDLQIVYPHRDAEPSPQKSFRFIEATWMAVGNGERLTRLDLSIPLETFAQVTQGAPIFTQLEHLGITIHAAISFMGTASYKIAHFVNGKCSKVRSLSLTFAPLSSDTVLPFFVALHPLPNLSCLSLTVPISNFNDKITSFLKSHSHSLQTLHIALEGSPGKNDLPHPQATLAHPVFHISYPNLSSLTLGLVQWNHHDAALRSEVARFLTTYLGRHASTLKTLRIDGYVFTFAQFISFMDNLGGDDSILESLTVQLHFLSCEFLQYLADNLQKLKHLDVAFGFICDRTDVPFLDRNLNWREVRSSKSSSSSKRYTDPYSIFQRDMIVDTTSKDFFNKIHDQDYSYWSLVNLDFEYRGYDVCPYYDRARTYQSFQKALANALSGVERFNGMDRKTFLRERPFTDFNE